MSPGLALISDANLHKRNSLLVSVSIETNSLAWRTSLTMIGWLLLIEIWALTSLFQATADCIPKLVRADSALENFPNRIKDKSSKGLKKCRVPSKRTTLSPTMARVWSRNAFGVWVCLWARGWMFCLANVVRSDALADCGFVLSLTKLACCVIVVLFSWRVLRTEAKRGA